MSKFLIGVLTGFILTGLTILIVVFAMMRLRERPPTIADGSTLVLRLNGEIPEKPPIEYPFSLFGNRTQITVENVWAILNRAAADSRIRAVVLEPSSLDIGWGKMQEIRSDLERFKKSGKPLYAFLKTPGAREYYLATAADRIYMEPEDWLNLKGLRFELMYFKKTLDKLGVTVQVEHAGKYKDFGDMFTRSDMSPATKEVLNSILDRLYSDLLTTVAGGRKKTPEEVKAIVDQGPFLADQALSNGLVDELRFEDQMFGELQRSLKSGKLRKVTAQTYLRGTKPAGDARNRIAFLVGEGGISRGDPNDDGVSDTGIHSDGFVKLLRQVGSDSGIKGVVVRIDSPGGEVTASDEIWREMNLLSRKKPLVISMSDEAASGGYYIALTGDPIVAYPGTLTGSIGVVFGKPVLKGLYDKLGVNKDFLTRGRFANIDSDYTPLSPPELEKLRNSIDASYKSFVTKVAEARHKTFDQVEPLAQGRVWLGSQAQERGLVDDLGGIDQAIALVKKRAHIPAGEKVRLVMYPPRRSIFDVLFNRSSDSLLEGRIQSLLKDWQVRIWMKGGLLRMMPYTIQVH